jgi:hypothetical protein
MHTDAGGAQSIGPAARAPCPPSREKSNQDLTEGAFESIGRSSSKEAPQQFDQRLVLTRRDDADFEVN